MSGAVYQPTTVTYESNGVPQERWRDRPISYLASVSQAARRPCGLSCMPSRNLFPIISIAAGIASCSLGIVLLIHGATGYSNTPGSENFYLMVTIFGALFFSISILLFVFFLRLTRRWCWANGKDHLDMVGGQHLTVNPSTDLLVTAQYAPVSEVAYQPANEDTEQSKLMPQDSKDLSSEDTERMVERDPRIVLRPLTTTSHEEA